MLNNKKIQAYPIQTVENQRQREKQPEFKDSKGPVLIKEKEQKLSTYSF